MLHRARWFGLVAVLLTTGALAAPGDVRQVDLPSSSKSLTLGPQEQLEQARSYVDKMSAALTKVQRLEEKAQKDKDVIRLNCLNDKVVQIRGHLTISNRSVNSLTEATAKQDQAASRHEYGRITILWQKVQALNAEAENCVGEDISLFPQGGGEVIVEIDPNIPGGDPTAVLIPATQPSARPTEASPII